ncbi:carboxypeptidase-like regulatory domain-containing protein [Antarcticibacterium sp. 1MA-6-2]|uniref:alpha-2-macroglobulin family protein n=1 Tax=Antarcticibacterium sp. 1MA-6-2 TaxID=2908210 RepID=UPI001F37C599|nr:carboxypeptidase-like regulatory domain-containing protein [Antarcticibacterium sp. 1MA-6-2]UJH92049.1 carboxypeptidase-like regulatory domain-containing protein [Antarcticibacterium sp. 1MA-6-2]
MPFDWKSGKYFIETESYNGDNTSTAKHTFDLVNPKGKYLPDNQRFTFSIQNKNFEEDKEVRILLQTAYSNINLEVAAYDGFNKIYSQFINLDGNREITIPFSGLSSQQMEIQVTGIKNNSAIVVTRRVQLPQTEKSLKIETETFRNKLQPGIEETWSFSVKNEKNAIPDAEILASMYDASLDQFVTQNWNTSTGFGPNHQGFPTFNINNIGKTLALQSTFSHTRRYRSTARIFDQLNLFGFYFSSPNNYNYRRYLNNKKIKAESTTLSGNTRGRVTDEEGIPLPGVIIIIKGTTTSTETNFNGEFALDTKKGDELIISFIGFASQHYKISEQKEIYIVLEEDVSQLDEVVTVGYGNQAVQEVAGSVGSLLQGKVAGVSIQENPTGSETKIVIRGASTVDGKSASIFVIDGEIVSSYDLSEDEIANIEFLEGEAATSIYGAQAANGAVIINTKAGLSKLQNLETRKNFDETAFFYPNLQLGKEGKLQFTFTSPEALTQWKLRLLAHTTGWTTGKLEATVTTQKELSLIPNPPRFLRQGDTITFKSKINNLSKRNLTGTEVLQLFNALTMEPIDENLGNTVNTRNFKVDSTESTVVSWKLNITEGIDAVTYKILAKAGDFTDGEENFLPVLSNRMLVSESLAFFVRAGTTESYTFKNLQDNSSTTLDHHKFTIEYSSNPAWYALQSLPYLMEPKFECSDQIFSSLYANSIAGHIMQSQPKLKEVFQSWKGDSTLVSDLEKNEELKSLVLSETPWLLDAKNDTEQKERLAELFDAARVSKNNDDLLKKLFQMQNFSGAWPWFPGGEDNYFVTRYILGGFGHMEDLGIKSNTEGMLEKAVAYLDKALLKAEKHHQIWSPNSNSFYKSISSLHHLYVRQFFQDEHALPEDVAKISDTILEVQKANWQELELYNKALLTIVLSKMQEKELARTIIASLKESAVRSEDYGMYWKENQVSWYWYRAPIETQALIIEAFSEVGGEEEAVEEMKIWLLQNKRTNHWPTTKSTTEASYALLMRGKEWLQDKDHTSIKVGGNVIKSENLSEGNKEAGTGYFKLNWQGNAIENSFSKIEVENENSTAGYGGAYWQYFEDLDKIQEDFDSPLNVEKELYLNVKGKDGGTIKRISEETQLKTGDLVTIRLVVRTTADMDFIHLKDMRASGFEPTNVLSEYKYQDGAAYYESTKDAATHFFFDTLAKGTYVLEYTVRANNSGNFSNGITLLESMYAPEFSSHTKGLRVNINE